MKLEPSRRKDEALLFAENAVMSMLAKGGEDVGIPKIHFFAIEGDYIVMIMDKLGPTLEDLLQLCGRNFSLKTVLMLAEQMARVILYWVRTSTSTH